MFRQILNVLSNHVGAVPNPLSASTREAGARIRGATVTHSICPYCAVGCAQLVYVKDGKIVDVEGSYDSPINGGTLIHTVNGQIVNIEGDPRSPHNEGTLCPKGAATFQLHVNPNRPVQVLHRAPGAAEWEVWDLDRAMDRVAELVKKVRDESFIERLSNGKLVNSTVQIFSLGGATLDIEFNHIHQKLMRGLGIVAIENQARI